MKKIIPLTTGIVIMAAILYACDCKSDRTNNGRPEDIKKVTIYLKSVEIDGKKHLEMSDSKNTNVIDSLTTDVERGTIVLWKLKSNSGIKKIEKINPTEAKPIILKKNPSKKFLSKTFKFIVPDDALEGKEKYAIDYIVEDDNMPVSIDPYIRIRE